MKRWLKHAVIFDCWNSWCCPPISSQRAKPDNAMSRARQSLWCWLLRFISLIMPRHLRNDWQQEWEAELRWREIQLTTWDKLGAKNKWTLL